MAAEIDHDNGTFVKPDEYHKFNGFLRYSFDRGNDNYGGQCASLTTAPSTRPIRFRSGSSTPASSAPTAMSTRPTAAIPTAYAMSTQWQHQDPNGLTKFNAYVVDYSLDLFSDFTYDLYDANNYYNETANPITCNAAFNDMQAEPDRSGALRAPNYSSYCPAYTAPAGAAVGSLTPVPYNFQCGDQREQLDKRVITGFNFSRAFITPGTLITIGVDTRNDNISTLGLFLVADRIRFPGGTLSDDHVVERGSDVYVQSELHVGSKLRFLPRCPRPTSIRFTTPHTTRSTAAPVRPPWSIRR